MVSEPEETQESVSGTALNDATGERIGIGARLGSAGGCFSIASSGLARRYPMQLYYGHGTVEINAAAGEREHVAGFDGMRAFDALAVEVDLVTNGGGGSGFAYSAGGQPTVDSHLVRRRVTQRLTGPEQCRDYFGHGACTPRCNQTRCP